MNKKPMENKEGIQFNQLMRERTLTMSIGVFNLFVDKRFTQSSRPVINQVIRSSSSVASNFRAATRARSDAEFYSKICIVMEECDETQFWFDYLQKINIIKSEEVKHVKSEIDQLVKIFSSIKKKLKEKQKGLLEEKMKNRGNC
jgi:four helix bundle protein